MNVKEIHQELVKNYIQLGIEYYDSKRLKRVFNQELEEKIMGKIITLDKEFYNLCNITINYNDGICPKCQEKLDEDAVFCKSCGLNIEKFYEEEKINCCICDVLIEKNSKYCNACGSNLKEEHNE